MLKGGLIGLGRMGLTHFSILNTHPEVQWTALCDSSGLVLDTVSEWSAVQPYTDYKTMLKEAPLDFVVVATPTAIHHEPIEAALERGLHVFVEKPLTPSADKSRQLAALAQKQKRVCQVGYFLRFNEIFERVRDVIQRGLLGDLLHYTNEMYGRTVLRKSGGMWRGKKDQGGGCMRDFAVHCLDLADFLLGPVKRVSGSASKRIFSSAVEDAVYTTLTHEAGLTGHLLVNWSDESYRRPFNRLQIVGSKGRIVADRQEMNLYLRDAAPEGDYRDGWTSLYLPQVARPVRFDIRGSEFTAQLDYFVDRMLGRAQEDRCSFSDALRTDVLVDAIDADSKAAGE